MLRPARIGIHAAAFCLGLLIPFMVLRECRPTADLDERAAALFEVAGYSLREAVLASPDGLFLYDGIIRHDYSRALALGTSDDCTILWVAGALSGTDGILTVLESDEVRFRHARELFRTAGLSAHIDLRLIDPRDLVPELEGPYDFILMEADRAWHPACCRTLLPRLQAGGCLATRHVLDLLPEGVSAFLDELYDSPDLETEIIMSSPSGMAVSYRRETVSCASSS